MTTDAPSLHAEEIDTPPASGRQWSFAALIGFRLAFCYWLLYCLPGPIIEALPGGFYLARPYLTLWHRITPWVAQHVFHLSGMRVTYFLTGSGDTTLDYVQNFLFAVIAILATLVWSLLDRRRKEYGTLYVWLRILVRFTLALILFGYGLSKVIPSQFRPPSAAWLMETYGESSPMHLLWAFMGASMPYTIFSGVAETTAALLLLFRRTALLGALVAAGVLLNIVMLNFCYDVPVKIYSTNLLLMAVFLLLPDASRLANVFLLNRASPPAELSRPQWPRQWMRITARIVWPVLVVFFVAMGTWAHWKRLQVFGESVKPPVSGAFDVEAVEINGKPAATVDAANANWKQIFVDSNVWMLKKTDGTSNYFWPTYVPRTNSVNLTSANTRSQFRFDYAWQDAQHLVLTGKLGAETAVVRLRKIDENQFLLTHRGFHWISEYPFNR